MKRILALSLFVLLLAGCKKALPPTRTIALLDISGSMYPEEVDREFAEMQALASELRRADKLVLVPITGNASNDTPGHILRLEAPTHRLPFDRDLASFRQHADGDIAAMKDWAKANPAQHTDLFGTLAVADREISADNGFSTKLAILSDFIEDDGTWNFSTDRRFDSIANAESLARADRTHQRLRFQKFDLRLKRLRSRDRAALSSVGLDAVDAFWGAFLKFPMSFEAALKPNHFRIQ